ncbi:exodeoxyribonuclease V subunit beta [Marinobacterium sediminicola]|uniref:RecBCD enzyme subunit RecB n=1 Tax=Marinobacterium sediminicola TaxID=518898 RepID=A0ABY1S2U5_9GAMM|nr:exodeoxyribonuclease V subunit beta [Marinobacterium sediminicola]ULG68875.1 exodeoxyribonuclease V subunit beta [Marinobacterium sediminicola]SMR77515.1 DNA helicase/exodeoxyribonuclease V, beta subunit [Marinobacterium sediminicola]
MSKTTAAQPQMLDALTFPLHGQRLIEASAGTGKTFTIAALYVRLVLGHGDAESGFGRPLLPPDILVVTFTNAATRELRDRIRSRLAEAAQVFRGKGWPDPFLQQLLAEPEYMEDEARALAARKLEQAAEWMDEAAVYTIHSWSQRMLTQHAFDTGSLFRQQLEQDDTELLSEMARDYWRSWCYALSPAAAEALSDLASDPDGLLKSIRPLLQPGEQSVYFQGEPVTAVLSPADYARQLSEWLPHKERLEAQARALWIKEREAIDAQLLEAATRKILNNQSYKPATLPDKLAEMTAWAEGGALSADKLEHFGQAKLIAKTAKAKQGQTPDHPVFELLQQLVDYLAGQPPVQPVQLHAARWIQQRFARARQRAAALGFNDMLVRLDEALQGEGSEHLASRIRNQYPVALIDEFQDTDPLQYRIFSRVYQGTHPGAEMSMQERSALLMIGDPKQAIYAFRGADIHTYLQARQDTAGRHYTLGRNFRSSNALVTAVNRLFQQAESSQSAGAFRFARDGDNPLPFIPVEANGRKEVFEVDGGRPAALTHWLLADAEADGVAVGDYRQLMAEHCASEICRLLTKAQRETAGFRHPDGHLTALKPSDIAILVRSGNEARIIREALERRAVRSVYLSDQASVYANTEAEDLWRWLRACAEPEQADRLHAALATTTLDLGYAWLEQLSRDEQLWEQEVERFRGLRDTWQRQGVLPMVRHLLDGFELPARLLQKTGGERVLTNLLHLAELLQNASSQLEGELALIRHLQEQILDSSNASEEHVMRLESDADLVQVVTIHKSKGLEYPLVFLPFICSYREVSADSGSYRYQTEKGVVLELDSSHKQAREAADTERLQEDLRLLYVALTRPVHACWLGVAAIKRNRSLSVHKSAFGQLLGCADKTDSATLSRLLQPLVSDGVIEMSMPPPIDTTLLPESLSTKALAPARSCHRPVAGERWWIASYSAIAQLQAREDIAAPANSEPVETAREETARESRDETTATAAVVEFDYDPHHFWKGPQAGTFLHGILEWAAEQGFEQVADDDSLRQDYLAPRCQRREWQPWLPVLDCWLKQLLITPLPMGRHALPLAGLSTWQAELEFWFEVADVPVTRLDRLIREHVLPGQPRPSLAPQQLGGMLKGFIDLVFEHEDRYWVADYKSNWLGPDDSCYSKAAMQAAILEKRYDVQYVLYLVALHRLLKARLPGYADDPVSGYRHHVGGALYLFLRGINETEHHGCFVDCPEAALIERLDRMLAGEEVSYG